MTKTFLDSQRQCSAIGAHRASPPSIRLFGRLLFCFWPVKVCLCDPKQVGRNLNRQIRPLLYSTRRQNPYPSILEVLLAPKKYRPAFLGFRIFLPASQPATSKLCCSCLLLPHSLSRANPPSHPPRPLFNRRCLPTFPVTT